MEPVIYHVIYDNVKGKILSIYSSYDSTSKTFIRLSKKQILSNFDDFFPEAKKVDILAIKGKEGIPSGMRVNVNSKKLEPIPKKRKKS